MAYNPTQKVGWISWIVDNLKRRIRLEFDRKQDDPSSLFELTFEQVLELAAKLNQTVSASGGGKQPTGNVVRGGRDASKIRII